MNTKLFVFSQGEIEDDSKTYPTVKIEFEDVIFQRLIDYQGSNKNRLSKYKGKYFSTKSVNGAEKVFLVEGIFDALSLEQSGIPAIATLSSGHNPETCFKNNVHYVLAFDNDIAGQKAIIKFKKYLNDNKIKFSVALRPKGKDWNDLLISDELSTNKIKNTLEFCDWRSDLEMAKNSLDYFEIYCKKYPYRPAIFEFKNQTYKGTFEQEENKERGNHKVNLLLRSEYCLFNRGCQFAI